MRKEVLRYIKNYEQRTTVPSYDRERWKTIHNTGTHITRFRGREHENGKYLIKCVCWEILEEFPKFAHSPPCSVVYACAEEVANVQRVEELALLLLKRERVFLTNAGNAARALERVKRRIARWEEVLKITYRMRHRLSER